MGDKVKCDAKYKRKDFVCLLNTVYFSECERILVEQNLNLNDMLKKSEEEFIDVFAYLTKQIEVKDKEVSWVNIHKN